MAGRQSRARFAVPALIGLVVVAGVWIFARPSHEPIVGQDPQRFALDSGMIKTRLAPSWDGPVASGGGTRCWTAREGDTDWRVCEDAMGHPMTVSASTPAFSERVLGELLAELHPDSAADHEAWRQALAAGADVETCSTAGPLWRAVVDGRVVIGSIGRCPPT